MRLSFFFLLLSLHTVNAQNSPEVEWKLPLVPVAITYSSEEGFGIKGTASLVTPIGQFSISSPTYNVTPPKAAPPNHNTINNRVIVEKPVYKDRVVYKEVKGEDRIIEVPVVKEVVKEVIVKEKEYLLVLRNKRTNNDMLFIIKDDDELEIDLRGHILVSAKEGQIIIDITDADEAEIIFNSTETYTPTDKIVNNTVYTTDKNSRKVVRTRQGQGQYDYEDDIYNNDRFSETRLPRRVTEKSGRNPTTCSFCNGYGYLKCASCNGKGVFLHSRCHGQGCSRCFNGVYRKCPDCHGQKIFSCPNLQVRH